MGNIKVGVSKASFQCLSSHWSIKCRMWAAWGGVKVNLAPQSLPLTSVSLSTVRRPNQSTSLARLTPVHVLIAPISAPDIGSHQGCHSISHLHEKTISFFFFFITVSPPNFWRLPHVQSLRFIANKNRGWRFDSFARCGGKTEYGFSSSEISKKEIGFYQGTSQAEKG